MAVEVGQYNNPKSLTYINPLYFALFLVRAPTWNQVSANFVLTIAYSYAKKPKSRFLLYMGDVWVAQHLGSRLVRGSRFEVAVPSSRSEVRPRELWVNSWYFGTGSVGSRLEARGAPNLDPSRRHFLPKGNFRVSPPSQWSKRWRIGYAPPVAFGLGVGTQQNWEWPAVVDRVSRIRWNRRIEHQF